MARRRKGRLGRRKGAVNSASRTAQKRGRKPIFTDEQKRVLDRLIRSALKDQLRNLVKSL